MYFSLCRVKVSVHFECMHTVKKRQKNLKNRNYISFGFLFNFNTYFKTGKHAVFPFFWPLFWWYTGRGDSSFTKLFLLQCTDTGKQTVSVWESKLQFKSAPAIWNKIKKQLMSTRHSNLMRTHEDHFALMGHYLHTHTYI